MSAFDDFVRSGFEESKSPFLSLQSRSWGQDLPLKVAYSAAIFLLAAFFCSFFPGLFVASDMFLALVFFCVGVPALIDACRQLAAFEVDIDVLMVIAAFVAIGLGGKMEGALLLVLFSLGGSLEESVTHKAHSAIHSLQKLTPDKARVYDASGDVHEKALVDVRVKDRILVRAGDLIPIDGIVCEGKSYVSFVHLTGESRPSAVALGDEVPGGALNIDGKLVVEALRTSSESAVSRIGNLLANAAASKPKFQRFLDDFEHFYAKGILFLTVFFSLFLPCVTELGFEGALYRSLTFLVAASPCALVIATPIAYLSAISACARRGILLKGGIALDEFASCKTLAFDKTGTLTTGKLSLCDIDVLQGSNDRKAILKKAAALELGAVHPIAEAIVEAAQGDVAKNISDHRVFPGQGVEAKIDNESVRIGSLPFIGASMLETAAKEHKEAGRPLCAYRDASTVALFSFVDTLRDNMPLIIQELKKLGLKLCIFSGDHPQAVQAVADTLKIDEAYGNLSVADKLKKVESVDALAMIGDGINDAPALARARCGISFGLVGSATAVEAASIILLRDDISQLGWLYICAKKTKQIVAQNIFFACGVIVTASLLAVFGYIPLWLAVILHEGGTIAVGLNGLRLLQEGK